MFFVHTFAVSGVVGAPSLSEWVKMCTCIYYNYKIYWTILEPHDICGNVSST